MLLTSCFADDIMFAHNRPGICDIDRECAQSDSPGGSTGRSVMSAIASFLIYFQVVISEQFCVTFCALTLLVGRQEEHPACIN